MAKRAFDSRDSRDPMGPNKQRRSHGKPMIKILCPYYCVGAIIGKGGQTIKELVERTECDVKVSKAEEQFPTTPDRVVSIQGEAKQVEECVMFIQGTIRKDEPPSKAKKESHLANAKRKEACKLIVSDISAGRIIGKGGQRIKDLKNDFNVVINISRKDDMPPGFKERCVSIEGEDGNVDSCAQEIVRVVTEDEAATMEWHVSYSDWNDSGDRGFNDRGFGGRDSGRDFGGRDSYGGGGRDDYGRGSFREDSFGGRDAGFSSSYGGGREDFGRRDDSRRDSGREYGRDSYRDSGRDSGRDSYGGRDAGYGGDRYNSRDSYGGRESYGGGYGGREMRQEPSPPRRDRSFGANDSFGARDAPRDDYGGRDAGRGYREGGYRDNDRSSMGARRDDFGGGSRDSMVQRGRY